MKLPVDGTVARSELQPLLLYSQLALRPAHIKMKTLHSPTACYIHSSAHLILSPPEQRVRSSIVPQRGLLFGTLPVITVLRKDLENRSILQILAQHGDNRERSDSASRRYPLCSLKCAHLLLCWPHFSATFPTDCDVYCHSGICTSVPRGTEHLRRAASIKRPRSTGYSGKKSFGSLPCSH